MEIVIPVTQIRKLILREASSLVMAVAGSENSASLENTGPIRAEDFRDVRVSDAKKEVSHPQNDAGTLPFRHH